VLSNDDSSSRAPTFTGRNLPLALCVLLCLLGVLCVARRALRRHDDHVLSTTVLSHLEGGVARAALPLPASIDPAAGFDIDAPRATKLFRASLDQQALSPTECSDARCIYHVDIGPSEPLTALVTAPGPYAFELTQRSELGEVHAHLALRVTP